MKKKTGPYVYAENMDYKLLEKDVEIAMLREHVSAVTVQMHEYHLNALRAMKVAVEFRGLLNRVISRFDGLAEYITG